MTPQPAANIENPRRVQHDPTRAGVWLPLAAAAVSALMACSSNARIPNADPAPAPAPTATETEPVSAVPKRKPVSAVLEPEPAPVEAPCPKSEVAEGTVSLCFVAYGDPTPDGSGPHKLIEGVQIAILRWENPGRGGGDQGVWWESVAGTRDLLYLGQGEQFESSPELIAAAGVPLVVTGSDGTAEASIPLGELYRFCAVHPDEPGLIAGCGDVDPDSLDLDKDYRVFPFRGIEFYSGPHRAIYVYFSAGRAFLHSDFGAGRYGRFLAGDTHPPGSGRVRLAGYRERALGWMIPVLLDEHNVEVVAVIDDEHIGEYWEATHGGWAAQLDVNDPGTWPPARLLVTGADGTASADLAAGDYLFCLPSRTHHDCTYQDVTAGQDRILRPWRTEEDAGIEELTENQSAQHMDVIATCNPTGEPHYCLTSEQFEQAKDHYYQTGKMPEGW